MHEVGPLWVGPLWVGPLWVGPLWVGPQQEEGGEDQMISFLRCAAAAALLAVCASAQFNCPDDSYLGGIASNVSGSTDKVLTLNITGNDKQFTLRVERKHVENGVTMWEIIEEVPFTPGNNPPVTIPPGCRASIQDTDPSDGDTDPVVGTATLT